MSQKQSRAKPANEVDRAPADHRSSSHENYEVAIAGLQVPRCTQCGKLVMTDAANQRVSDALRRAAGLSMPEEIKRRRDQLELTQKQFAALLAVADATVSRWETGAQIQQRSLDRFMRIVFASDQVREALADEPRLASLGLNTTATATAANVIGQGSLDIVDCL